MKNCMTGAGPIFFSETGVSILRSTQRSGKVRYSIGSGWLAVVRALGLKAGDRVQLEPVSRDPWRLRLTVLPTE